MRMGPVWSFMQFFFIFYLFTQKMDISCQQALQTLCSLKTQIQMFEKILCPFNPNDFHHFFFRFDTVVDRN